MSTDTGLLIQSILNVFSESKETSHKLNDLKYKLSVSTSFSELWNILQNLNRLFELKSSGDEYIVNVAISLRVCREYNNVTKGCSYKDCKYLHTCEDKVKNFCNKKNCLLNHKFDVDQIKNNLIAERFNYTDLMKFYQTFYAPKSSINAINDGETKKNNNNRGANNRNSPKGSGAASASNTACANTSRNSSECSGDSSNNSKHKIIVQLPLNFVKERDRKYLFNLFTNKEKTGGGYIDGFDYFPEQLLAYITFKRNQVYRSVLHKKEIVCDEYKFIVRAACEKNEENNESKSVSQACASNANVKNNQKKQHVKKQSQILPSNAPISPNGVFFKNQIYLTVPLYRSPDDANKIQLNAAILAMTKPEKVTLVDDSSGKWHIEFPADKEIEIGDLWKKYELASKLLRISDINIEPVYANANPMQKSILSSESSTSIATTSTVNSGNRRTRRRGKKSNEENKKNSTANNLDRYLLKKSLVKNEFLSMILIDKHQCGELWRNELQAALKKEDAMFTFDKTSLNIVPINKSEVLPLKDWFSKMNRALSDFFNEFKMEKIEYDQTDEILRLRLRLKIEQTKIYMIGCIDDIDNSKMYVMGKKVHFDDFLSRNENFKDLFQKANTTPASITKKSDTQKPNKLQSVLRATETIADQNSTITKHFNITRLVYTPNSHLINQLLDKLKRNNLIQTFFVNTQGNLIDVDLTGPKISLNNAGTILQSCLARIRTRPLEGHNMKIFMCKHLELIVTDCLRHFSDLLFRTQVFTFENKDKEPGIFITYFQNVPDIESANDSVYDRVKSHLNSNIDYEEIDITKHSHIFLTPKWVEFRKKNLEENMCHNNFEFSLGPGLDNKTLIYLIGKKIFLERVKMNINKFILENETKANMIKLDQEKVMYLQNINNNELKMIERLHEIEFEFDNNGNLVIKNCPGKILKQIEAELNNLIQTRRERSFNINYIPGIEKIFEKNSIQFNDIQKIQDDTKTLIFPSNKQTPKPAATSYARNQPKSDISDVNYQTKETGNHTSKTVVINNVSVINLQVGNLINSKAHAIVNVISSTPESNMGILAKSIYAAAGDDVLAELLNNMKNDDSLTVTSAYDLNNVLVIFHSRLPPFSSIPQGTAALKAEVNNCLNKLIELDFTSISFPTLGLGNLGYPIELVASVVLKTIHEFFDQNKKLALTANVVIFEKDTGFNLPFMKELNKLDDSSNNDTDFQNLPITQMAFRVVYKEQASSEVAIQRFKSLLNDKYMRREKIEKDSMKYVDESEIKILQRQLCDKFKDCQISYNNKTLEFYGSKESVLDAKAQALDHISKQNNKSFSRIEESMRISKDIQWQYEAKPGDWKNFPVYLNSLIESKNYRKESTVEFQNEDNEKSIVYLNIKPNQYSCANKTYNVRRIDVTKLNEFAFPKNWSVMQDNADVVFVDLPNTDAECITVFTDFTAKLGARPSSFKLQRIQNPYLYRQYSIHKEKFVKEKRQPNEKQLFHGSTEDSLKKICRFGFNRSFCGKNGVAYGKGVYFAANSQYSNTYAIATSSGLKCMIRALVLVGESCVGNSSMNTPPEKQTGTGVLYDSTCDGSGSIYVCYHDNQCYPEYLIYYS